MNEIDIVQNEKKKIPIFTKLILGKIFDYKYSQEQQIKNGIFKFTVEIKNDLNKALIISHGNKKENLLNNNFKSYTELEKEIALIKDKITEEKEDFKWYIEQYPLLPEGNMYLIKMVIKKELPIDFNILSEKNQFNYKLKNKLPSKNVQNLNINKI